MRVLVAVASSEEDLLRARKHLGYDKLVVVAPEGPAAGLQQALRAVPGAQVAHVPGTDLLACLSRLEAVLAGLRGHDVRVAVDGGTSAMSAAAFLACLSRGVEAWFLLHHPVRLPVLAARPVARRFPPDQAAVLAALEGRMAHEALARATGLPLDAVRGALRRLRDARAVAADATHAEATDLGRYYQRALVAAGDAPGEGGRERGAQAPRRA